MGNSVLVLSIISVSIIYKVHDILAFGRCICGFYSSDVIFFSLLCIVGIRQLQLMLLKMALLLGIEIHVNVEFKSLIEPPEDQETESK